MSRKLSAAELFEPFEIDLWGNEYKLRSMTRSASKRIQEVQKHAEAVSENDDDIEGSALVMIEMIDALIEPTNGAVPATELLTNLWEKDELGIDFLNAFSLSLGEEAAARRRPTSASPNGTH